MMRKQKRRKRTLTNRHFYKVIAEKEKVLADHKQINDFLYNCLNHVTLVDQRSNYQVERDVFVPNSIKLVSEGGKLGEGIVKLLEVGWNTVNRKLQKFYQGDKHQATPYSAAYCASFNQACMMWFNIDTADGSIAVDNMDDAQNLLKMFHLFGAVSLGELSLVEEELNIDIFKLELEDLEKEIKRLKKENARLKNQPDESESDIEDTNDEIIDV